MTGYDWLITTLNIPSANTNIRMTLVIGAAAINKFRNKDIAPGGPVLPATNVIEESA